MIRKSLPSDLIRGWKPVFRIRSCSNGLGPGSFADLPAGRDHGLDDVGIAGAAANLAAKLVADGLRVRIRETQQDITRHHQHARRAKSALQRMALVEVPAQHFHDAIVAKSFESLHGTAIAHDREAKA